MRRGEKRRGDGPKGDEMEREGKRSTPNEEAEKDEQKDEKKRIHMYTQRTQTSIRKMGQIKCWSEESSQ